MNRNAISLFSSSGIGDLGLKANGIKTVIANELLAERMKLFKSNYPDTKCFLGDIWELQEDIIKYYNTTYDEAPFMILATPPCQGMSSNGMGKMLSDYRKGLRPKMDERNRLIIPAINIIKALQPEWVILENVANMTNTLILDEDENIINIIDYIKRELGGAYVGEPRVIDVADYGVPQHRKRLITVLSKNHRAVTYFQSNKKLIPDATHSAKNTLVTSHWVTLREAIGDLPELRAEKGKNQRVDFNPLHKVPLLDEKKLFWVDNTPEGETAFNNQCVNPNCLYQGNQTHGASHDKDGINKAYTDTPLFCEKCGAVLPRPWVEDKDGTKRLMKGFVSAYKRMLWDEPASTLTQNFQYACSDNKLHPSQSRVLSLYEGLVLQSIAEYEYSFVVDGKMSSDGIIRDTIGESVPPKVIDMICRLIIELSKQG
ncbi:MAG: DNA cytosine methyltransferase [Christensenellaceae bacterium]|nr:DNA cytosine methyltransferase [Christensenellaceae bacterium]